MEQNADRKRECPEALGSPSGSHLLWLPRFSNYPPDGTEGSPFASEVLGGTHL